MNNANVIEQMCNAIDKATTAIILTHNIDFLFVESLLLPRLRHIGHPHLTIFADSVCAAGSFRIQHDLIERLGIRYRVVPVDLGGARRFHPKAFFLCNEVKAALAVGSGNTTHGGWSANQEVWSDFSHPDRSGGPEIAAFRDYLETILTFVPEPESIRKDTLAAFTFEGNKWLGDLPRPGGLAWTPSTTPMLTQITDFVGNEIRSIDVVSPYFDPEGTALSKIAEIAAGDVNVLLQPQRAGLSKDIAVKLTSTVKLRGIEDTNEERRHKFIHAKAYVFHTVADSVIAVGSANCSMAALLANASWGNAELMALSRVSHEDAADLLSNFSISEVPPELPDTHPADDWKIEASELRILAARKDGTQLDVHYKALNKLFRLMLCSSDNKEAQARNLDGEMAGFTVDGSVSVIWLKGVTKDGLEILSLPSWVDDERSLRMSGSERHIHEKLDDAAARGSLTGVDLLQILELFDHHIQRPVATGAATQRNAPENPTNPVQFSEDDIYSDGFGRPPPLYNPATPIGFSESDTLALFLSFFLPRQQAAKRSSSTPQSDEENEDENKEARVETRIADYNEKASLGAKILRVLKKIETALARPEFISGRTAARLSADIAFISLLMTKSAADGYITPEQFRLQTLKIWTILFFGDDGANGVVPRHLEGLDDPEKVAFIAEMRSPKLSAAMALWCMIEWDHAASDARAFRFASALLAARYFWLSQGGTIEEINAELDRIATKLLPMHERERLFQVWADWVRDGQTLEILTAALASKDQKELADLCVRTKIEEGELAWQNGRGLCSLASTIDRANHKKALLIPINQSAQLNVRTAFIAPLREILASDIGVSDHVKRHVFVLVHAIGGGLRQKA